MLSLLRNFSVLGQKYLSTSNICDDKAFKLCSDYLFLGFSKAIKDLQNNILRYATKVLQFVHEMNCESDTLRLLIQIGYYREQSAGERNRSNNRFELPLASFNSISSYQRIAMD